MVDTLFLRAVAILLITNSHLDSLYATGSVSFLGTGGALGNSLFFMLSGLGLGLGTSKKGLQPFRSWMHRRISRIYPSIWIVVLLLALGLEGAWQHWAGMDYLHEFFYPTSYWFISALVVFYILLYPLLKNQQKPFLVSVFFFLFIPYLFFYLTMVDLSIFSVENSGYFKWIYYFQIMLFGTWLAKRYSRIKAQPPSRWDILAFLLTLMGYGVIKVLIEFGYGTEFQGLVQWLMFPFVYYALKLAQHPWVASICKHGWAGVFVMILGTATLEIYLVQHHIYSLPFLQAIPFPLNILIFALICIPVAYGVHKLSMPVQTFLGRKPS